MILATLAPAATMMPFLAEICGSLAGVLLVVGFAPVIFHDIWYNLIFMAFSHPHPPFGIANPSSIPLADDFSASLSSRRVFKINYAWNLSCFRVLLSYTALCRSWNKPKKTKVSQTTRRYRFFRFEAWGVEASSTGSLADWNKTTSYLFIHHPKIVCLWKKLPVLLSWSCWWCSSGFRCSGSKLLEEVIVCLPAFVLANGASS